MRVSRIPALLITAMMIPAISGCTTQGTPAPDAVHQIEDGGPAVYDDDPIADGNVPLLSPIRRNNVEPQIFGN